MKLLKIYFLKNIDYCNEYYGLIKFNLEKKIDRDIFFLANLIRKTLLKDLV